MNILKEAWKTSKKYTFITAQKITERRKVRNSMKSLPKFINKRENCR